MRGAKRQCCCVPVTRVQRRPEWNVDIPPADSGVPQARSHLAFIRGGAAQRGMKVYYESSASGRTDRTPLDVILGGPAHSSA